MSRRKWTAAIIAVAVLVTVGIFYVSTRGPSDEEVAAADAAEAEAAAQIAGDECRDLTEDALASLNTLDGTWSGSGLMYSEMQDMTDEVNIAVETISYVGVDEVCEEQVGVYLEEAAISYSLAERFWSRNLYYGNVSRGLQDDFDAAEQAISNAEDGLDDIYSGDAEGVPTSTESLEGVSASAGGKCCWYGPRGHKHCVRHSGREGVIA